MNLDTDYDFHNFFSSRGFVSFGNFEKKKQRDEKFSFHGFCFCIIPIFPDEVFQIDKVLREKYSRVL